MFSRLKGAIVANYALRIEEGTDENVVEVEQKSEAG